ncbi:phosphoribosylanthranilate isomerase [Desulfobacter postgatei]|uniref:N-(5'-phosphoribosyl)anthranilate isomerase n=1 Tax=Desulfobacter postgatei 2ac9 TaxID=879212 RepID=I5AZ71_9BACT|nr:phosphoribosylanthranilate isomerase [Desulfobacter postgatei]EIM62534.1 phosphoribosylanthranilate isomerase [Desulfobacter postgatei 2ac9]
MTSGYKAKICGTTNMEDAEMAAREGADFFGVVVEVDFSPRSLTIEAAKPLFSSPLIPAVALVYNMASTRVESLIQQLNPFAVQFLSLAETSFVTYLKKTYPKVEIWQSLHLPRAGEAVDLEDFQKTAQTSVTAGVDALLFDTAALSKGAMKFGGTGVTSDWDIVKELMDAMRGTLPIWLAGGINPDNVGEAIDRINPYGIDLCSGVEATRGKKDAAKLRSLMTTIRGKHSK